MTAIEWLFEKLWQLPKDKFSWYNVLEEAKEMEKRQHGNTWDKALDNYDMRGGNYVRAWQDFDDYYNETYGSGVLKEGSGAVGDKGGAVTSSQTEISDEEIEKAIIDQDIVKQEGYCHCFLEGAKWYREQLKSK